MPLTPIDIQQKTFGPELRGYNMDEVDDFLDEVVATLKDYDQRVRDAQDRIRALEAEIATRGEDETAISRALVAAQKQADTMLSEAREAAETIRNEAHDESDRLRAERDAERQSLTQEIARMRATVADLKRRVVELAASAENDLDAMDAAAAEASTGIAVTDEIEMTVDVAEGVETEFEAPAAIEEIEEVEEIEVVEEFEEADAPAADDFDEDEAVLRDDEDDGEDVPYAADADDVDDETWAEVEGSYEEGDEDHDGPDEGKDIGELADELAGEASARSGQHLSADEAGGRAGRRPWERGSV